MKDYKSISDFDADLHLCKMEISIILQKYDFGEMITSQILIDEGASYLKYINQQIRDKIINNERLTNKQTIMKDNNNSPSSFPIILRDFNEESWEQRQYEITKDVTCAIISNFRLYSEFEEDLGNGVEGDIAVYRGVCQHATLIADEMIKQLKATNK